MARVLRLVEASPRQSGKEPTVLVVDPDATAREFIRTILAYTSIGVLEAETIAQARAAISRQRVHVALVEVNLVQVPGDVLAEEMAQAGVAPILMTGTSYGLARAKKGRFPLLPKPLGLRRMLREIVLALPVS